MRLCNHFGTLVALLIVGKYREFGRIRCATVELQLVPHGSLSLCAENDSSDYCSFHLSSKMRDFKRGEKKKK